MKGMSRKIIRSYDEFLRVYLPKRYTEMIAERKGREASKIWRKKHPVGGKG